MVVFHDDGAHRRRTSSSFAQPVFQAAWCCLDLKSILVTRRAKHWGESGTTARSSAQDEIRGKGSIYRHSTLLVGCWCFVRALLRKDLVMVDHDVLYRSGMFAKAYAQGSIARSAKSEFMRSQGTDAYIVIKPPILKTKTRLKFQLKRPVALRPRDQKTARIL